MSLEVDTGPAVVGLGQAVTTIATRIRDRAQATPGRVALREKDRGIWLQVTWAAYWDTVQTVAHGLLALGVEPGDRVAVHADNRREWLYADVAALAVRAASVGIYPTSPGPEVRHVLAHSGARVLIAEDQEQVDKVLEVIGDCPELRYVVYLEQRGIRGHYDHPKLMSWADLLARGAVHRETHPDAVAARMAAARPADVATVIYTSGTSGPPKGVMLSVANGEFAVGVLREHLCVPPPGPGDMVLSYLPLCHIAERIGTTWLNAAAGVQVAFAESIATVQEDLVEVQPTILLGVPRIWEKVLARVQIGVRNATPVKRAAGRLALALADRIGSTLERRGGRHTVASRAAYAFGWLICYRALRKRVGLRFVRHALSGAAPIAPEVLRFFMGIGVPMYEGYAQTEGAGVATVNRPGRIRLGTVGEPQPGVEVRLDPVTGEILIRHPGVFPGYHRDPQATAAARDADGWLHTGDVGEWTGDGSHLRITDRIKDIIITAGGKNIAPSQVENLLKASPYVKEAIVIGDRRAYPVALIGIEADTVGEWALRRRLAYTTYRDLTTKPEVVALVQQVVDEANCQVAAVARVKKFRLLPAELDHSSGELTATQKLKRAVVAERHAALIDEMYEGRS